MNFKGLKEKKWFNFLTNKYILILLVFLIWMLFLDANSLLFHRELNEEIDKIKDQKEHFQKEIQSDKEEIKKLKNDAELEKYAREKYYMKKEGEEIYIIEYEDSLDLEEKK